MKKDIEATVSAGDKRSGKKSRFLRVFILVLAFCIAVVTALVVSDFFFSKDNSQKSQPELVAVSVAGDKLILNSDREVTLSELRDYMNGLKTSGKSFVGSIINDTANPADVTLYNQVVDLFAEFDIICEKLATTDEATFDEVPATASATEITTASAAA